MFNLVTFTAIEKKKFYLLTFSAIEVADGQQKNYSEDVDGPHSRTNIYEDGEEEAGRLGRPTNTDAFPIGGRSLNR